MLTTCCEKASCTSTSFPGSLLHAPGSERGETLVGAGHVSPNIWEITNECQFAYTKCTGDGKTCPSENQLAESRVFRRSCQVVQKPASESVNVGCCRRLCKSVGDTGNLGEIFTAKPESTTYIHTYFIDFPHGGFSKTMNTIMI